ncbi:MAG: polysaccharide biosynthesis protein, partial [Clostridiales bacterium]|nr:polysaccharide biosynthesis protein [Clostridiales bacterium]
EFIFQALIARNVEAETYGKITFTLGSGMLMYYLLFGGRVKFIIKNTALKLNFTGFNRLYFRYFYIPLCVLLLIAGSLLNSISILEMIFYSILMMLFMEYNAKLFGWGRPVQAMMVEYVIFRVLIFLGVLILLLLQIINLATVLECYLVSLVLSIAIQKMLFKVPKSSGEEMSTGSCVTEVATFQGIEVLANTFLNIPRIAQYFIGGALQSGFFGIAMIVRQALSFIAGPTAKIFFSQFAESGKDKDVEKLKINYRNASRWQTYFILPAALAILHFPGKVTGVFGGQYKEAEGIVILITAATFFEIAFGPSSNFLQMVGREKKELVNQAAAFITFVLLILVLPAAGAGEWTVPIALSVDILFTVLLRFAQIHSLYGIIPYTLKEGSYLIICGSLTSVGFIIAKVLDWDNYFALGFIVAAAIILQFLFSPETEDRYFIRRLFYKREGMSAWRGKKHIS